VSAQNGDVNDNAHGVRDMNQYTVLLLYPDYMADNFGQDTYLALVEADSVAEAQELAREKAAENDPDTENDFHVLATFHGWHDDVKEAA